MERIGLPQQNTIEGFRRDFSPSFIHALASLPNVSVVLELNYGKDLHYKEEEYLYCRNVSFEDRKAVLENSDILLMVPAPEIEEIERMHEGQILIAMLHYPTHPVRNDLLQKKSLRGISLDALKDYEGKRMIQDFKNTAYNAVTAGFIQLRQNVGDTYWFSQKTKPIFIYQMGFGEIGRYVVEAALRMGNTGFQEELEQNGYNAIVEVLPTVSHHSDEKYYLQKILSKSLLEGGAPHLFIDATKRSDPTQHIITEEVLALLPNETVLIDVTADRYENGTIVKGIQGIPTGDEKQHFFEVDDPSWTDGSLIPKEYQLRRENRRTTVSHYAWGSYGDYHTRRRMVQNYATQLLPVMRTLLITNIHTLKQYADQQQWSMEKALYQSTLEYFSGISEVE